MFTEGQRFVAVAALQILIRSILIQMNRNSGLRLKGQNYRRVPRLDHSGAAHYQGPALRRRKNGKGGEQNV